MLTKKKWALFSLLTLCGGTIYKLPSLKDAFYIPMQEYFHLTNGQIGNAMSVNSFVTTVGFFLSIYFADKLPRRYTMSFSLIATGLLGVYLTTMPGYWGILFVWALFGVTCDMMNWPVLLKSVSRLGNSEQQGRLFGFFETGRGIVDTVVAFSALAVFTWFGSGLLGFKAGIWFYSLIVIAVGIIIFFVLNDKEEAPSVEVKKEDGASQHTSMTSVLKDKTIWLIAFNVFFVYAVYCGLTFFIPFLKNIYLLPVALVGAYGIIIPDNEVKAGDRGVAVSRLAPMGKVEIGGRIYEAKSTDVYIDQRSTVEVVGFENFNVVVRKVADEPSV